LLGDSYSGLNLIDRDLKKKVYSTKTSRHNKYGLYTEPYDGFTNIKFKISNCLHPHEWQLISDYSGTSDSISHYSVQVLWQQIVNSYSNSDTSEIYTNHYSWINTGEKSAPPKPEFSPIVLKRAERLLDRLLTSRQRKYWDRNRYIDIQSPSRPNVLYRVPAYGKIMCFESGKLTKRLCIYVLGSLPLADKILTLKMMIEADEPEFLKIANVHPVYIKNEDSECEERAV